MDDDKCISCNRPTVETDDPNHPLRRCHQGESVVYVLCARCEQVARDEVGVGRD